MLQRIWQRLRAIFQSTVAVTRQGLQMARSGINLLRRDVKWAAQLLAIVLVIALYAVAALSIASTGIGFVFLATLATAAGFTVFLFALPLIPNVIDRLTNDPNANQPDGWDKSKKLGYPKSQFGFFTYLQPGRVKNIERGERFIEALMAYARRMFRGEQENPLTRRDPGYWEVVDTPDNYSDSHPIPFPTKRPLWWYLYAPISVLWWAWKRWVYRWTGGVFTGIYPFQKVRVYPMERFKKVTEEDGRIRYERVEDYSDHYRVAHFQYPVRVPEADTKDMIAVRVSLNEIARVFNPYLVAYNTDDDWPTRLLGSVTDRVNLFTRPRPLSEVWTERTPETAGQLATFVTQGGKHTNNPATEGSTCAFGVEIVESQVLDISPVDPEKAKALGDVAVAKVDAQAATIRAKGTAAPVREVGKALRIYPEADIVVNTEAMIRTAKAAGDKAIVFLGGGPSTDPGVAAVIKELRDRLPPRRTKSRQAGARS